MRGIGLPGHFIAALYHAAGKIFIDPFNRGEIRSVDDCLEIVRTYTGETVAPDLQLVAADRQKRVFGTYVEESQTYLCPAGQ